MGPEEDGGGVDEEVAGGRAGVGAKGEPRRAVRKEKRDLLVWEEEVEGRCCWLS